MAKGLLSKLAMPIVRAGLVAALSASLAFSPLGCKENGTSEETKRAGKSGGKIAFKVIHGRGLGNEDIYIMNADGSNYTALTNIPDEYKRDISWSPDGKKIAFISGSESSYGVYIVDVDGSNLRKLTDTNNYKADLDLSPDGKKIAFASLLDRRRLDICVVDGSNLRNLTNTPDEHEEEPRWSPDGKKILYYTRFEDDIYIMNANGKNKRNLTNTPNIEESYISWSPDGKKIAFIGNQGFSREKMSILRDIYVMNVDGSNIKKLTDIGEIDPDIGERPFCWSPDGKKIAFVSISESFVRRRQCDIYIMDADGTNKRNLTNTPDKDEIDPSWSRDGKKIAFECGWDIYTINVDGSDRRNLTNTPDEEERYPCWSPF